MNLPSNLQVFGTVRNRTISVDQREFLPDLLRGGTMRNASERRSSDPNSYDLIVENDVERLSHSSICAPNSTTRFGGIWKNALAGLALRDKNANRIFLQRAMPGLSVMTSVSRPKKKLVSS